jgi:rhomboid protease GluP
VTEPLEPQPRPVSYPLPLHQPVATWILLALIGLVFAVETALGGSTDRDVLIRLGAKVTPLLVDGQYWRLLTSMFLHIGLAHLFFNGYALLVVGTEIERLIGWGRFAAIYFLSGLLGSLASFAFSVNLAAGASGAIFGVIGALGAYFFLHRERLGSWGRARLGNIIFVIVLNLFWGFTQPGIDNYAHLGGLISGAGLGWALAPRYEFDPFNRRVIDRNNLRRYWPALVLAVALLVEGTALAAHAQRDNPQVHLQRAQQAIESQFWAEAASELEQALDLDPSLANAAVYVNLGLAYSHLNDPAREAEAYEQALALDPSLADASIYFQLGLAYNYLDKPDQAAAVYEQALALEPDLSPAHWNLALSYMELHRYADARDQFQAFLELNPDQAAEVQPYLDELQRFLP